MKDENRWTLLDCVSLERRPFLLAVDAVGAHLVALGKEIEAGVERVRLVKLLLYAVN